jgi:hypothetical protein
VGDSVVIDGVKCEVSHFVLRSDHGDPIVHFKGKMVGSLLREITKHTPKLIKVKRTFEEVCELVKQKCLFKSNLNGAIHFNSSTSLHECGDMFIAGVATKNLKFKPKNSDTWQELEYKEVEE